LRRGRRTLGFEGLENRELLATLYVAPTGSDSGPGTTTSPFRNIQEAVTAASSGDQIRVAAGVYTFDPVSDHFGSKGQFSYSGSLGTTAVVSVIGKQLSILGGFSTSNWETADPKDNLTIIDGQGQNRGIMVLGTSAPTSLALDGFTIQNGLATGIPIRGGLDASYGFGGGIFVDMGGAQGQTAPWSFNNLVFLNNRAVGSATSGAEGSFAAGGAVALRFVSSSFFANDVFTGNQAIGSDGQVVGGNALGGAIHIDHSNMLASQLTFTGNMAKAGNSPGTGLNNGVTADALGGAIAAIADSAVALVNVKATGNLALAGNAGASAGSQGGSGYGGAFYVEGADVTLSLTSAFISGNQAWGGTGGTGGMGAGGGIETNSSTLILNQSTVVGNAAATGNSSTGGTPGGGGGGGLYLTRYTGNAASFVTNSVIAANSVLVGSGNGPANGGGGGIWVQGVPLTLTQDTIANNSLDPRLEFGQALLALNYGVPTPSIVNINDSIIANENASQGGAIEVLAGGNQVNLNQVLSWNNRSLSGITQGGINGLNTVTTANPTTATPSIFVAAAAPQWDYHLNAGVPNPAIGGAIGSTTTTDIDGNPRDRAPDLGAAEATAPNVEFSGPVIVQAGGNAVVTLLRHGDLSGPATVLVSAAAGGTARSGVDYAPFPTNVLATVNFAAGAASATAVIPTLANDSLGASRTLNLSLSLLPSGGSNARLGAVTQATVTIVNNAFVATPSLPPPVPPVAGFAVTSFQPMATARGVNGVLLQFNAALNPKIARNRAAYALRPVGVGRIPRISLVNYVPATKSVVVRFTAAIRPGTSVTFGLNTALLRDTAGRPLSGTTSFTISA